MAPEPAHWCPRGPGWLRPLSPSVVVVFAVLPTQLALPVGLRQENCSFAFYYVKGICQLPVRQLFRGTFGFIVEGARDGTGMLSLQNGLKAYYNARPLRKKSGVSVT